MLVSKSTIPRTRLLLAAAGLGLALRPTSASAQTDPRFGAMTHFAQGANPAWAATVGQLGIATVRDELYWNQVEPSRGVYSFQAEFETYMAALKQRNISPFIVLDFENQNYDGGNTPYDADGFTGYANYAAAVLQHYGSQIQAVEIWNEYNGTWCKGPATNDRPGTYTQMLKAAYARIKAVRPDVTVAGGSTAGIALSYWTQLMQDGALPAMDVLSVHPYRYNSPPEGIEQDIASLQSLVKQYNNGVAKPIWASEIGWQVQAGSSTSLDIDEATQAKFLTRCYALLLSAGVQRIYWYDFSDDPGLSTMGLTDTNGTPRQSGYAFQTASRELQTAAFVQREATASSLYSILFTRADGTPVRVLWSLTPVSFQATGISKIVDLTGDAVPVTGTVNLTDSPIFVEGPMAGLPASSGEVLLTDSARDFAGAQGQNGWWYGAYSAGASFQNLPTFSSQQWSGAYSYGTITLSDQHPSVNGSTPVPLVRRWVSTYAGNVHIVGNFQAENTGAGGDGVGVTVLLNGKPATVRTLIGSAATSFQANVDLVLTVQVGSTIDFAVDPGPAADMNYDATGVTAKISTSQQAGTFVPAAGSAFSAGTPPPNSATTAGDVASTVDSSSSSSSGSAPSSGSTSGSATTSSSAAAGTVLADSAADFSGTQGQNGWWYGDFATGAFEKLPTYAGGTWGSQYPYISITQGDQHPSVWNSAPVSSVRRWVSTFAGPVQIAGSFQSENTGGDGVGVTILVNGQPVLARTVLGASGSSATQQVFSLAQTVQVGSTVDFVVDAGPGTNIDFDATSVAAKITVASAASSSGSIGSTGSTGSSSSTGTGASSGSGTTSTPGTASSGTTAGSTTGSGGSTTSSPATPGVNSAAAVQANSSADFALTQGQNGWSYGYFAGSPGVIGPMSGSTFLPMTVSGSGWAGPYPSLAITAGSTTPSASGGIVQLAAVRRWTSAYTGNVQVTGSFQIGHDGDGVGVTILVNGQQVVARTIIGNSGMTQAQSFSFTQAVAAGTTIDFVVDPGPGRDPSSDTTAFSATLASVGAPTAPAGGAADTGTTSTGSSSSAGTGTTSGSGTTSSGSTSATGSSSGTGTTSSGSTSSGGTTTTAATPPPAVAADSAADFSLTQGQSGWSYGYFTGSPGVIGPSNVGAFLPMTVSGSAWAGPFPLLAGTASTLSPSAAGIVQVAAVRRWTSSASGKVQVAGSFQIAHDGDGVGVTVLVNGQPAVARTLIGNSGATQVLNFTFAQAVAPGTTIDFVVDAGPGRDDASDSTTLKAAITTAP